jgi:hypothetical protein
MRQGATDPHRLPLVPEIIVSSLRSVPRNVAEELLTLTASSGRREPVYKGRARRQPPLAEVKASRETLSGWCPWRRTVVVGERGFGANARPGAWRLYSHLWSGLRPG